MTETLYNRIENFYRSVHGMHRFLENQLGLEVRVMRPVGTKAQTYAATYGKAHTATTQYTHAFTTRVILPMYNLQTPGEEAREIDMEVFSWDPNIQLGDVLMATIGKRNIYFKVVEHKRLGFGEHAIIHQFKVKASLTQVVNAPST